MSTNLRGCALAALILATSSLDLAAQNYDRPLRPPGALPSSEAAYPRQPQMDADPDITGSIPADTRPLGRAERRPQEDLALTTVAPAAIGAPQSRDGELDSDAALPQQFRRQVVDFPSREPVGTIVIDTSNTFLYLVLGDGRAIRYGVGVGRDGFTWSGTQVIKRVAEWPDWRPPAEMIERQPYLPRFMAGGSTNPLGARALYLGDTVYRIHGTNEPATIGSFVSSGCIRLVNEDIVDLYNRVGVGTRVVVLPGNPRVEAELQRR